MRGRTCLNNGWRSKPTTVYCMYRQQQAVEERKKLTAAEASTSLLHVSGSALWMHLYTYIGRVAKYVRMLAGAGMGTVQ